MNGLSAKSDPQEIRRAIAVLFDDTSVVELRALEAHHDGRPLGRISGYFDGNHREELAQAADAYSGLAPNIYVTLNPVNPALLGRAANRPKIWAKVTTADEDILCRRWLGLDIDSERPTGISATDSEHDAAIGLARDIKTWLSSLGWPEPILASSGNGAHLLYRIDLPNDAESTTLVKGVLAALAERWSNASAKVDKGVFNASRIWKLYGTLAAKGDPLPDRPHRIARMIDVPLVRDIAPRALLESLASIPAKPAIIQGPARVTAEGGFELAAWIQQHNVPVTKSKPYMGGTLWEIARCPWKPESTDGGPWIAQLPNGHVLGKCKHNSCLHRTWHDFRDYFEPGWRHNPTPSLCLGEQAREGDSDPHRLARLYLKEHATDPAVGRTLRWWAGDWYRWNGAIYVPTSFDDVRAELVACVKAEFDRIAARKGNDVKPVTPSIINGVILAMQSEARIAADIQPPAWLASGISEWPANQMIVAKNGLIHLPSFLDNLDFRIPATPKFFSLNALGYEVVREPETATRWLSFLKELWPDDPQSIDVLQMWFGLCLTPNTSQHKILFLVGPPRSGKGTIAGVLTQLLGESNVVSPMAGNLISNFGLQGLIGKSLAIISDARISNRLDSSIIVERLLSISGEDSLLIDRKNREPVNVKLTVRLMIMSNELPRLADASGALASRLVILRMTHSFLGREDLGLADKLRPELPAIFHWAAAGCRKLWAAGKLVEPESSRLLRHNLEDISSPVGQFVRECCERALFDEASIARPTLYNAYTAWCRLNGIYPESSPMFGKSLRAVVHDLDTSHVRMNGRRERRYVGIQLTSEAKTRLGIR